MGFNEYLSYSVVGLLMIAMVVLLLALYYLYPTEIYYWDKMCDKCSQTTVKYRYVIRFIFGKFKTNFQLSSTTITIEVWDSTKVMVALQIPPKLLSAHIPDCPTNGLNCVRFLLYRKEPLLNICNVVVNHNGSGTINVTTIEIQDINSTEANIAYIGVPINCLSKEKAITTQMYPSATKEWRPIEADLKPRLTLRATEYLIFIFMAINLMSLLPIYLIPCPSKTLCNDYSDGVLAVVYSGLLSGTIGGWTTIVSLLFYRYIIKSSIVSGADYCSVVRYVVLSMAVILGLIFGLMAAVMAANNRKFPEKNENQSLFHEIYWVFATGIALITFFAFWFSSFAAIAYLIGFFSEPLTTVEAGEAKDGAMDATTRSDIETDEQSSDYYNTILKGDTKVKSISQYTGLSKGQQKPSAPSASVSASTSKGTGVQRSASSESQGSNYYKELMKGYGKVKSVSQYKGPAK